MRLGILTARWGNAGCFLLLNVMTNSAQYLGDSHSRPAVPRTACRQGADCRMGASPSGVLVSGRSRDKWRTDRSTSRMRNICTW